MRNQAAPMRTMRHRPKCSWLGVLTVILAIAWAGPQAWGLQDEMDLIDQVRALEEQLGAESLKDRDEAQAKLVALGVTALEILRPIDQGMSSDMQQRLRKVRQTLETLVAKKVAEPAKVTWSGVHTLQETLDAMSSQTGNTIKLSQNATGDRGAQSIEVNWDGLAFWDCVKDLQKLTKLQLERYEGDGQEVVLSPGPDESPSALLADLARFQPVVATTGCLMINVDRIDTSLNLTQPSVSHTQLSLTVRWEPRLRPILLQVPYSEIQITDDRGTVQKLTQDSVSSIPVASPFSSSEFSLQLPVMAAEAREISAVKGELRMLVPGRREKFEFTGIDQQIPGIWQEKGDAKVTFGGIRKNEDLFVVRLTLGFAEGSNVLESHQSWALDNPAYLLTPSGERIDFIGLETFEQSEQALGVAYLFPELPPDSKLVYETPSVIVKLTMPFTLEKIPLR